LHALPGEYQDVELIRVAVLEVAYFKPRQDLASLDARDGIRRVCILTAFDGRWPSSATEGSEIGDGAFGEVSRTC
jgi:hypothetical protein